MALWDIISPTNITLRAALKGHEGIVFAVELNETNIITGSPDDTIKVQYMCAIIAHNTRHIVNQFAV